MEKSLEISSAELATQNSRTVWYSYTRLSIICNFHPLSQPRALFKIRLFGYLVNNLSFEICSVSLTSRSIIIMGLYIIMITNWEESESARESVCEEETRGSEYKLHSAYPWDDTRNICRISHLSRTSQCQSREPRTIYSFDNVKNVRCISFALMRQKHPEHQQNQRK